MRPLRIAFAGASGTGKSTLAAFVSERYGLPVNPVGSRSVAAEMGFASPYDVDAAGKRAEFQMRMLAGKCAWEVDRESFVTDRTAVDQVCYWALHDVRSIDAGVLKLVQAAMMRYTHVVYCPVGVFRSRAPDPARVADETYHEVYDAALFGFLKKYTRSLRFWDLEGSDLDGRKEQLVSLIEGVEVPW